MQVLVTGYGGFLGSALCRQLIEEGFQVRGIARQTYPSLKEMGVECLQVDLRNPDQAIEACRGVGAIIHTAALAGVWGKRRDYEEINVKATESLLQGAQRFGVGAFVYSSSPSVTFDGHHQSGIDESVTYPNRWLCDYPRTKAIAEQQVLAADASHLRTCSLRPHLIWGQGDPHLIPRLIDRCRRGRLRRVGSGTNLIDTVHVDAAALAHVQALHRLIDHDHRVAGEAFFITDGQPVECWQWISNILKLADLEPPHQSISLPAAYRIGGLLETIYRLARIKSEPPMTRFVALQLGVNHYFSIAKARERLGYLPIDDRSTRLEAMAPWLKTHWLKTHCLKTQSERMLPRS